MITLLLYIILVAVLGWAAVWLLGQLAPGHPAIIDRIIWVVVVVVIVVVALQAFGVTGSGPQVPRIG